MFEEHFNSDTLMAMVICSFVIILALILVTTCLVWPAIEGRARMKKEEHDDFRGLARDEHRKYVKALILASNYDRKS